MILETNRSPNLLYYNEEFDEDYWFKNNLRVLANQMPSPTGDISADLLIADIDISNSSRNLSSEIQVQSKGMYTFSIYARADQASKLILRLGSIGQRAVFDLREGIVSQKMNVLDAGIEALPEDWYRCFITVDITEKSLAIIGHIEVGLFAVVIEVLNR